MVPLVEDGRGQPIGIGVGSGIGIEKNKAEEQ